MTYPSRPPPVGDPWTAPDARHCAAWWWATRLTEPAYTEREAAQLQGGSDVPEPDGLLARWMRRTQLPRVADDRVPVASAVDLGLATGEQVDRFAAALAVEIGGYDGPVRVTTAGGDRIIVQARAFAGLLGITLPLGRWEMDVTVEQVRLWPMDDEESAVVLWPYPAADVTGRIVALAARESWKPAADWAAALITWDSETTSGLPEDPWRMASPDDRVAAEVLLTEAIRRTARDAEMVRENVVDGRVPLAEVRAQILTPQTVAALLAQTPRPPDDLGGRQYDRLAGAASSFSGSALLANAALERYQAFCATGRAARTFPDYVLRLFDGGLRAM